MVSHICYIAGTQRCLAISAVMNCVGQGTDILAFLRCSSNTKKIGVKDTVEKNTTRGEPRLPQGLHVREPVCGRGT